jgi:hypothetical protein
MNEIISGIRCGVEIKYKNSIKIPAENLELNGHPKMIIFL